MMRLPRFRYFAPRTVAEAAAILAGEGPQAMVVAGGTDLLPNMKRRHQTPKVLVGLRAIEALRGIRSGAGRPASKDRSSSEGRGLSIGPATSLTDLERSPAIRDGYPGLYEAIHSISTPILRNMGTIGGNLCLDTRCNYYNQNYEWRRAIDFCMKCDGSVCWVAPGSDVCLAVSSSDSAPMLCALGARLRLVSKRGARTIDAADFFRRDGIHYLTKRSDEILADIALPPAGVWRSAYRKLRRRGAFDFPVVGVAVAVRFEEDGRGRRAGAGKGSRPAAGTSRVAEARIWLGAVSMAPLQAAEAEAALVGRPLDDEAIAQSAGLAYPRAKPVDNTDYAVRYRKEMTRHMVADALRAARSPTGSKRG